MCTKKVFLGDLILKQFTGLHLDSLGFNFWSTAAVYIAQPHPWGLRKKSK